MNAPPSVVFVHRTFVTGPSLAMVLLLSLSACATHRSGPPNCKGAFTPINQATGVSHAEKR